MAKQAFGAEQHKRLGDRSRPSGAGSGGVDAVGIQDSRLLPDDEFGTLWDSLVFDTELKDQLLGQALLSFSIRGRVDPGRLPIHGVILLVGPPGTGKTSLARSLASKTAELLKGDRPVTFLEVEPHALTGASLGRSQKAVTTLLGDTISGLADVGPLIVMLDEVETLAPDRSKLSFDANPIDVHRATDAVLTQLDLLAARHPELLFLATSNFETSIDPALISRADLVVTIGLPGPEACRAILVDTLMALALVYPRVANLPDAPNFERVVDACVGLDGRRIRKLVAAACALRRETAMDPNQLTVAALVRAAELAVRPETAIKGERP